MAAGATVYATDPMQAASAANAIPTSSLATVGAKLGIASAVGNIITTPFNVANQYRSYKTQAANAANTAQALKQERDNTLRIFDRESRQLAANQTLAFMMSGLESSSGTVQNVMDVSAKERRLDRGNIESNYNIQISNATAAEKAANKGAKNSLWGGVAQVAGTVGALAIFSDERLKERLIQVGKSKNGLKIYLGRYTKESGLDDGKWHLFLIAQEVQRVRPNAVKIADNGYFQVDYAAALL